MKRLLLWSMSSVLLILLLAACGGDATKSESSTTKPESGVTKSGSQSVQVTENDMTITSSLSTFTPGVPYHFVVKNAGNTTHEFMIMPKDEGPMGSISMDHMDGIAMAKIHEIKPGETKTLDYTFPDSTKGSHPQFVCYEENHYDLGMKLNVSVSQ